MFEVHDHDNHENQQGTKHDDEHKTLDGAQNIYNKHQALHQEGHSSHDHGKQINEIKKSLHYLSLSGTLQYNY